MINIFTIINTEMKIKTNLGKFYTGSIKASGEIRNYHDL